MAFCNVLMKNCLKFTRSLGQLNKCRANTLFTTSRNSAEISKDEGRTKALTSMTSHLPSRPPLPLYTKRDLSFPIQYGITVQAWVENMDTIEQEKLGIVDLHPEVYGVFPRIDLIYQNFHWQRMYRKVNWDFARTRAEMPGGGRKPWPQKGTGRARHGSIRSPLWKGGGKAHGPRGPKPYFYMLERSVRVHGLVSTLSGKLAQDDVYIVDSLEIPTDDPKYLEDLIDQRHWGLSVLFVDDTDLMPRNIALAADKIPQFNLMPVYGLNVYSMLKHETLVLTLAAAAKIEERILYAKYRIDSMQASRKFMRSDLPYSPLLHAHLLPKSKVFKED